jgi:16S rRNA (cytidine1402-2'-O)-methyltransferase
MKNKPDDEKEPLASGLYIVGTPIGNLEDITLRALDTLRRADLILAEDTRHTRRLLTRYDIGTRMISCHKFNEAARTERIIEAVQQQLAVALVTDAGMPAVSDPGARTVATCRAHELYVTVIPGPSSVSTALALSGMGGNGYHFEGFLPRKSGRRQRRLAQLAECDVPVILFESPYRLLRLMEELESLMGSRRLFVGRELTKRFEEGLSGTAAEIRSAFEQRKVKGELTLVISPEATSDG